MSSELQNIWYEQSQKFLLLICRALIYECSYLKNKIGIYIKQDYHNKTVFMWEKCDMTTFLGPFSNEKSEK